MVKIASNRIKAITVSKVERLVHGEGSNFPGRVFYYRTIIIDSEDGKLQIDLFTDNEDAIKIS